MTLQHLAQQRATRSGIDRPPWRPPLRGKQRPHSGGEQVLQLLHWLLQPGVTR